EAHGLVLHRFARFELQTVVVHHDQHAVTLHHRTYGGVVERHDRNLFQVDVLPDIQLGPVGEREDTDTFPRLDTGVVQVPKLRALVLGVPAVVGAAEGEDALLGPRL